MYIISSLYEGNILLMWSAEEKGWTSLLYGFFSPLIILFSLIQINLVQIFIVI